MPKRVKQSIFNAVPIQSNLLNRVITAHFKAVRHFSIIFYSPQLYKKIQQNQLHNESIMLKKDKPQLICKECKNKHIYFTIGISYLDI